jgi:hypothetical protein
MNAASGISSSVFFSFFSLEPGPIVVLLMAFDPSLLPDDIGALASRVKANIARNLKMLPKNTSC